MKHTISKIILLLFIFTFQGLKASLPNNQMDINCNEKCKLLFRDSTALSGYVRSQNDSTLNFERINGEYVQVKLTDIIDILSLERYKTGSVGIGIGPQYGYVGINAEWEFWDYAGAFAGVGTVWSYGTGYNAGINFYIFDKESSFRPRISIMYGTNNHVYVFNNYKYGFVEKLQTGFTCSIGISKIFGEESIIGSDFSINIPFITGKEYDHRILEIGIYTFGIRFYL